MPSQNQITFTLGLLNCAGIVDWNPDQKCLIHVQEPCGYQRRGSVTDDRTCPRCGGLLSFSGRVVLTPGESRPLRGVV